MKAPKPSEQLISAAKAVITVRAMVETLRPKIREIQTDLLYAYGIKGRGHREESDHYLTPDDMYLMSDGDAAMFYPELDKAYRKAGFTDMPVGHCPLLIAEDLLRKAERLFMETSIEISGIAGLSAENIEQIITCSIPNGIEMRKKYLDLNLRYVVPFIRKEELAYA